MTQAPPAARPEGMVRETFRHAAIYSGATMLGRFVSFLMLPFYAHILRDVGYGIMGMIDASLVLLSSLLGYGFRTAVLRIYHEETDPARKLSAASTGTILVAVIVLPLAMLGMGFSKPMSSFLFGSAEHWNLVCLAMATFYSSMISDTAMSILVIQRRSVTYSLIGLGNLVVGLSLNILLVVILRWDLLGFFLSGLIVSILGMSVKLWFLWRICGLSFERDLARRLLAFQLPQIPGSVARFFSRQVERVIVRYRIDLASVGILEMAYKFPVLLNILVITPFNQSWGTKAFEIADQPGAPARIGQVFSYYVYLIMLGGLILVVNIEAVLQILTPPEFWPAYRIARVDTLGVIMHGVGMQLCFGITYAKRMGLYAKIVIANSAIKILLSWLMISQWGLFGAAWSGTISATIHTIWCYGVSQRFYRLQLEWLKLTLVAGVAVGLFLVINAISQEAIAAWGAPLLGNVQDWLDGLRDTWVGGVRDGKVLTILTERRDLVFDVIVRTLLVSLYLVILPLVHVETQRKLRHRFFPKRRRA